MLIVNVVTKTNKNFVQMFPSFFNAHHLAARRALFYECLDPEHLEVDELVKAYQRCDRGEFCGGDPCIPRIQQVRRGSSSELPTTYLPARSGQLVVAGMSGQLAQQGSASLHVFSLAHSVQEAAFS